MLLPLDFNQSLNPRQERRGDNGQEMDDWRSFTFWFGDIFHLSYPGPNYTARGDHFKIL